MSKRSSRGSAGGSRPVADGSALRPGDRRPGKDPAADSRFEHPSGGLAALEAEVTERIAAVRVLPVASFDDPEQVEGVARALISAGLSCIEIAFRTPAAAEAVTRASRVEGLLVGAGTILTPEQARAALEAGASFAVAPGTNELVMNTCREIELPFFPGVATPSEIDRARSLGARTLKVFPISQLGGVGFLRAMSTVYPDVRYIPTGGIDAAVLPQYLALDSVLACAGSWFVAPDLVRKGCFDEITRLAREAVEAAT